MKIAQILLLALFALGTVHAGVCRPSDKTPDAWKKDNGGPYVQAPAEYGDFHCYVNPFNPQPWLTLTPVDPVVPIEADYPEGFLRIYGKRPSFGDSVGAANPSWDWIAARNQWDLDLKYFVGLGEPDWMSDPEAQASWTEAKKVFIAWGMGEPVMFHGRYGFVVTFPDAALKVYEAAPFTAVFSPHNVVARYQTQAVTRGIDFIECSGAVSGHCRHPFVPPHVFGDE